MAEVSSIIAAVLSGVLVAALVFYVWGRRVERQATEQSQRLVLAAKEELMAVRENLHKSLDQKLSSVDARRPNKANVSCSRPRKSSWPCAKTSIRASIKSSRASTPAIATCTRWSASSKSARARST